MTSNTVTTITTSDAVLVFGGPYSNLQATRAVLAEAKRLGIRRDHTICTGDLVAYCAAAGKTIELVRRSRIHVVMGNCDEQLAKGAQDCGCGFPQGSTCERLSSAWFAHADRHTAAPLRRWLATLPRRIDLQIGEARLAVIHGSVSVINQFVFAATDRLLKHRELDLADADGVIAGHTGLPFSEVIDGRLWHNAGVVGMPANDGTPRVWYSLLTDDGDGISIEHRALDYDHVGAAADMHGAGLPREYRDALSSGIWPSCDVLPAVETSRQGEPLTPARVRWTKPPRRAPLRNGSAKLQGETRLLWPQTYGNSAMAIKQTEAKQGSGVAGSSCCEPTVASAGSSAAAQSLMPSAPPASCCAPSNADATRDLYREAALVPDSSLCCISNPTWQLPGLTIPRRMIEMNYGCGSTVHPGDLGGSPSVLYVGAGAGLELLQFAYFSRRRGAVIGLDVVDEMMEACRRNLAEAEETNDWFKQSFVELRKGDAVALPVADASIDIAAQNCLFNIFHSDDLQRALGEIARVLKPGGRLLLSDPICDGGIPEHLRSDERLRAMCLTGALSLDAYITRLAGAGFGRIEVRSRRPYRVLGPQSFATNHPIVLESVEICAFLRPVPPGGPDVYAGEMAIYFGTEPSFSDGNGLALPGNQPLSVSMADAARLRGMAREDIFVSQPTWFHGGAGGTSSGCC